MRALVIFDLDGTLVDSKADLIASVNHVRHQFGMPVLQPETVGAFIGNGAEMLIRRALGETESTDRVREGLRLFLTYYREHMLDRSRLYPGVAETLEQLSGCTLAVLTNKPVRFSHAMLDGLGIHGHFRSIYGGNSFDRKKPDPVGVYQILMDAGHNGAPAWMVGDSAVDVLTGRNAGIRTCAVRYGYGTASLEEHPADVTIERFDALPGVLGDGPLDSTR